MLKLSKSKIESFEGDILTLRVISSCEKIKCIVKDTSVAGIRDFGNGRFFVTLIKVGNTEIIVESGDEIAICNILVNKAKISSPDGNFKIYVGDTHSHTSYSDGISIPEKIYSKVREEGYFDFFTVSDHTSLQNDENFFRTYEAAEEATTDDFVAFPGSESQIDLEKKNSIDGTQNNGGEIVTINADGYAAVKSWEDYFEKIGDNKKALAIIAHPQIYGYSVPGIWNSFNPEYATTARTLELIHGVETLNETDNSNLVNERAYSLFLDCGYKVAPIGASDHHGPRWGKIAQQCRTFVYSEGHSKDYFIDALRNARAYSCENGNVKLFYTVNGHNPATTLPITDTYEFKINAEPFYVRKEYDETDYIEVISDYGMVVASKSVGRYEYNFDITVKSDTARYFYLKLYSKIGDVTWSAPIFTGRPYDIYPKKPFNKKAINDELFRIKSWSGGKNGGGILNTDTSDYLQLDHPNGELTIDMGKARKISAIGYFPMTPRRKSCEDYASFLSKYEYHISLDGIEFTKVTEGRILLYGSEHIAQFSPVEARYLKLRAVSTVGSETRKEKYKNIGVTIGSLRVYG